MRKIDHHYIKTGITYDLTELYVKHLSLNSVNNKCNEEKWNMRLIAKYRNSVGFNFVMRLMLYLLC